MIRQAVLLAVVFAMACGGSEKRVTQPGGGADVRRVSQMPTGQERQTATGELRAVLLSLKRVHFAFDSYNLTAASRSALADAADKLRNHADVELYVQGHADERGTAEYNLALGERRGRAVTSHLVRLGVAPGRLAVVSYGEEIPLIAGQGESAWSANRRVEYRLMRGSVELVLEEGTRVTRRPRVSAR